MGSLYSKVEDLMKYLTTALAEVKVSQGMVQRITKSQVQMDRRPRFQTPIQTPEGLQMTSIKMFPKTQLLLGMTSMQLSQKMSPIQSPRGLRMTPMEVVVDNLVMTLPS